MTYLADDVVDLLLVVEGEAVQKLASEGSSGRFEFRTRPVNSTDTFPIMAAIRILFPFDDYTGVKQGASKRPKE